MAKARRKLSPCWLQPAKPSHVRIPHVHLTVCNDKAPSQICCEAMPTGSRLRAKHAILPCSFRAALMLLICLPATTISSLRPPGAKQPKAHGTCPFKTSQVQHKSHHQNDLCLETWHLLVCTWKSQPPPPSPRCPRASPSGLWAPEVQTRCVPKKGAAMGAKAPEQLKEGAIPWMCKGKPIGCNPFEQMG